MMAFVTLSESSEYRLAHQHQDWHGWPVRDPDGRTLGRVADFIIDTDGARAVSVVLDTTARIPLDSVRVRDGYLMALPSAERGPDLTSAATPAAPTESLQPFANGRLDVMEHAEIAVVTKRAKVIEEVVITREVVEREERVRTTVKRVDVDVEALPPPNGGGRQ